MFLQELRLAQQPIQLLCPSCQNSRPYLSGTQLTAFAERADDRGEMSDAFTLQILLATFAGWVNRHQAQAIDYLVESS